MRFDWCYRHLGPNCPDYETNNCDDCRMVDAYNHGYEQAQRDSLDAQENAQEEQTDSVNHPAHYTDGNIEVIDFIEDKKLPYHLGNVVKYICRAGKKDPDKLVEDLEKAEWYLKRYIANKERTEGGGRP